MPPPLLRDAVAKGFRSRPAAFQCVGTAFPFLLKNTFLGSAFIHGSRGSTARIEVLHLNTSLEVIGSKTLKKLAKCDPRPPIIFVRRQVIENLPDLLVTDIYTVTLCKCPASRINPGIQQL